MEDQNEQLIQKLDPNTNLIEKLVKEEYQELNKNLNL